MSTERHEEFNVLVVCRANVCRSPLIEHTIQGIVGLRSEPWRVHSRGTHSVDGVPMCPRMLHYVDSQAGGAEFCRDFRSQRISAADIEAGLILAATRAERSLIVRSAPHARRRVFTLLEAVRLAKGLQFGELAGASAADVARSLDRVRRVGQLDSAGMETVDIPDPHSERVRHSRVAMTAMQASRGLFESVFGS